MEDRRQQLSEYFMVKKIPKGYKFFGYFPPRDKKSLESDMHANIIVGTKRYDGDVPFWFKNKKR